MSDSGAKISLNEIFLKTTKQKNREERQKINTDTPTENGLQATRL